LTDFEFMVLHRTLHDGQSPARRFRRGGAATLVLGFVTNPSKKALVARLEYALFRG
jgi:hypothetical protein